MNPPDAAPNADAEAGGASSGTGAMDAMATAEATAPGGGASIPCGQTSCAAPASFCCVVPADEAGAQSNACSANVTDCLGQGGTSVLCSSSTQCASGQTCCGVHSSDSSYADVACRPTCSLSTEVVFCNPSAASDCPQGMMCQESSILTGMYVCV
jgi:hypothetical protein